MPRNSIDNNGATTSAKEIMDEIQKDPITIDALERFRDLLRDTIKEESFCVQVRAIFRLPLIARLLEVYEARKTHFDLLIYEILSLAESSYNVDFSSWSPLVFGPKARENYENLRKLGTTLHIRMEPAKVLEYFDQKDLWTTVLHCNHIGWESVTMYDERFVLHLLASIMGHGTELPLRKFVELNALSLALSCTSSRNDTTRKTAYYVLQRYLSLLNTLTVEKFVQRPLLVFILRLFKNSIESEAQLISNVLSQYFARVCKLALVEESPVFPAVMSYLTRNCFHKIPLEIVPDWQSMLFSSSTMHHQHERHFILEVIQYGCCEPIDYSLLINRGVLRSILTIFSTPLSDNQTRLSILDILKRLSSMPTPAHDLIHRMNLPVWIEIQMKKKEVTNFERGFLGEIFSILICTEYKRVREGGTTLRSGQIAAIRLAAKDVILILRDLSSQRDVQSADRIEKYSTKKNWRKRGKLV